MPEGTRLSIGGQTNLAMIVDGTELGPYRVVGEIGKGGMGRVYKAYHAALDRFVAIKLLDTAVAHDPEFVERFRREARLIANLRHPNILPVYDFGLYAGLPYLVMEYVPGGTLATKGIKTLSSDERRRTAYDVAAAIDYAHAHDVLHRDVKPENVLLADDGRAMLSDFGLARVQNTETKLTVTGTLIGSPEYMSPEQALGQPANASSDLYSFGVMLYELTTNQTPFKGELVALLYSHVHQPPPPPSKLNPELTPDQDAALIRAIAKQPEARFESARAAAEAVFPPKVLIVHTKSGVSLRAILIGAAVEVAILTVAFLIWYAVSWGLFTPPPPPASIAPSQQTTSPLSLPKPPLVPPPDQALPTTATSNS